MSASGFACVECGHVFATIAAAERASFGPDGCPSCGGADIDEVPVLASKRRSREERAEAFEDARRRTGETYPDSFDVNYERARARGWAD